MSSGPPLNKLRRASRSDLSQPTLLKFCSKGEEKAYEAATQTH